MASKSATVKEWTPFSKRICYAASGFAPIHITVLPQRGQTLRVLLDEQHVLRYFECASSDANQRKSRKAASTGHGLEGGRQVPHGRGVLL